MTRGERNNNPLNIRRSKAQWLGMRDFPTDKQFCEFQNITWGFRAAFILLSTYYLKHKCCTIRQVITRWAPPSENNTANYIDVVCSATHLRPDDLLPAPLKDMNTWCAIVRAMAKMECGKWWPISVVAAGWHLATRK